MVLSILLANHTADELFSLPSMRGAIAGLLMYNERHMQRFIQNLFSFRYFGLTNKTVFRLSRLRQNTAILPYTASKIQATRGEEVMETN